MVSEPDGKDKPKFGGDKAGEPEGLGTAAKRVGAIVTFHLARLASSRPPPTHAQSLSACLATAKRHKELSNGPSQRGH